MQLVFANFSRQHSALAKSECLIDSPSQLSLNLNMYIAEKFPARRNNKA
jgi:hypothetical protein